MGTPRRTVDAGRGSGSRLPLSWQSRVQGFESPQMASIAVAPLVEHWPELLAVDRLRDRRPAVADEPGDVLQRHARRREHGTKLCRISRGVHSRGSSPAACTTRRNERRTLCASSSVPAAVANTSASPDGVRQSRSRCRRSASTQRCGIARRRRDFLVLCLRARRTERRTEIDGGAGGAVDGRPIRSTSSQRNARSSSVRAPISSDSTTYACSGAPSAVRAGRARRRQRDRVVAARRQGGRSHRAAVRARPGGRDARAGAPALGRRVGPRRGSAGSRPTRSRSPMPTVPPRGSGTRSRPRPTARSCPSPRRTPARDGAASR